MLFNTLQDLQIPCIKITISSSCPGYQILLIGDSKSNLVQINSIPRRPDEP